MKAGLTWQQDFIQEYQGNFLSIIIFKILHNGWKNFVRKKRAPFIAWRHRDNWWPCSVWMEEGGFPGFLWYIHFSGFGWMGIWRRLGLIIGGISRWGNNLSSSSQRHPSKCHVRRTRGSKYVLCKVETWKTNPLNSHFLTRANCLQSPGRNSIPEEKTNGKIKWSGNNDIFLPQAEYCNCWFVTRR